MPGIKEWWRRTWMSAEERLEEDEINRDVRVKMGKNRLRKHINNQHQMEKKLTELARRAIELEDDGRFRQLGRQLLFTRQDVIRWERYLLTLEMVEARREQAKSSVELLRTVQAMSESMMDLANPQQAAEMQRQLQVGLARAESLDERMSIMMDMMDSTLEEGTPEEEQSLSELEKSLTEQITQQESAAFDREIEEGLRKIRDELKDQEKK